MAAVSPPSITTNVAITLNAVLAAMEDDEPKVLCVKIGKEALGLPYGPFDPERHRTFEIGVREWVSKQTNLSLGYIEQLYTFGDEGREAPAAALAGISKERIVSVGYLALAAKPAAVKAHDATWRNWYSFFPWEDWRSGEPALLKEYILPTLEDWIKRSPDKTVASSRRTRVNTAFGLAAFGWEEERTLDRYEIIYEAGLVIEAWRDRELANLPAPRSTKPEGNIMGAPMISDHRRMLATAIGRLRGKLKYRPVIFDMTPAEFTLLQLQKTVEAIVGFNFHKQNFRRSIEKSGFIKPVGRTSAPMSGRPAALFTKNIKGIKARTASGLAIPRKQS